MAVVASGADWSWGARVRSASPVERANRRDERQEPRPSAPGPVYEFGVFRLLPCGTLQAGSEVVPLTPKEEAVLRVLVTAEGRRVSKDTLLGEAWQGAPASDASLTRAVHTLRGRLREAGDGRDCIRTVYGRGYHLALTVRRVA
jgi:DNA-binding winged helix-turn-helix (wHTH) protein